MKSALGISTRRRYVAFEASSAAAARISTLASAQNMIGGIQSGESSETSRSMAAIELRVSGVECERVETSLRAQVWLVVEVASRSARSTCSLMCRRLRLQTRDSMYICEMRSLCTLSTPPRRRRLLAAEQRRHGRSCVAAVSRLQLVSSFRTSARS